MTLSFVRNDLESFSRPDRRRKRVHTSAISLGRTARPSFQRDSPIWLAEILTGLLKKQNCSEEVKPISPVMDSAPAPRTFVGRGRPLRAIPLLQHASRLSNNKVVFSLHLRLFAGSCHHCFCAKFLRPTFWKHLKINNAIHKGRLVNIAE